MIVIDRHKDITLQEIEDILNGQPIEIDAESYDYVLKSFNFLSEYSKNKVIYGINTGLGPMAQYKIDDDKLVELQYNLIRSHSSGCGKKIEDRYVKAAMVSRLNAIAQGVSGIHPSVIKLLAQLINKNIFPIIPEHGGVGASGDLVQLSHLALSLIGEGKVSFNGEILPTAEVFKKNNLEPISIVLREGLSLINGTSVMTGIGLVNVIQARRLFNWSLIASAMLNEIVESFDDHFSDELNKVKHHQGQQFVAAELRRLLMDSKMISRREEHFYDKVVETKVFKKKVQEYYSLRCLPQILGPIIDVINNAQEVMVGELNSVSDNPIVNIVTECVYHGGNFHGDYVSLEMDKLKLAVTRISMLSERQINYLFNPRLNEKLPPFVNLGVLGLNLGMQGVHFTATSTTAENQTLSTSMYVHSIPTNNDNQDIVSMGTNSALLTARVIDNSFQVMAIQMMALLQAVDYLKIEDKLSSASNSVYQRLRALVPVFVEDTPKYEEVELLRAYLSNNNMEQ